MRATPVILLILSLIPVASLGQVYSWRDASGKIHYGDRPPVMQQGEARKLAAPPSVDVEAERKALAERQLAEREKQQKAQENSKKTEENEAEARKREEGCRQAKSNLAAIESGQVRFTIDAKGERVGLDGAAREAEIAKARKAVNEWCAPPKPVGK
jgi:membrane protein involved in colicin uptake